MDAKSDNPLDVATKAVSFNVMLQLLMRVSSFALNGFVLRYIQPELLGVVNLRLTLLYSTILFLSREAFRRATLTSTSSREREWTYIFNTMWMV
jgi:oligosaccharide translocation protein RFT1